MFCLPSGQIASHYKYTDPEKHTPWAVASVIPGREKDQWSDWHWSLLYMLQGGGGGGGEWN